jgi:hypothetical protein
MLHYKESIEPSGNYTVLCEKKWESIKERVFLHKSVIVTTKGVEIGSRMFYTLSLSLSLLRGCWCRIVIWNVCASREDKGVYSEDNFCENLSRYLIRSLILMKNLLYIILQCKIRGGGYFQTDVWEWIWFFSFQGEQNVLPCTLYAGI